MTTTTAQDAATRDRVDVLLRSFLSPGMAARVRDEVPAGADRLGGAVALLRELVAADDESLVVALGEAGVGPADAAALVGVDARTANAWLDVDLDPAVSTAGAVAAPPRGLTIARYVVRVVWIVLALVAVVSFVQARGGLRPCGEPVCIDAVELLLENGTAVPAADASTYDSDEVRAVRFTHRTADAFEGEVIWTGNGEELLRSRVTARGDASFTVPWPGAVLPFGVHVVRLDGAPSDASVTFSVQPEG